MDPINRCRTSDSIDGTMAFFEADRLKMGVTATKASPSKPAKCTFPDQVASFCQRVGLASEVETCVKPLADKAAWLVVHTRPAQHGLNPQFFAEAADIFDAQFGRCKFMGSCATLAMYLIPRISKNSWASVFLIHVLPQRVTICDNQ